MKETIRLAVQKSGRLHEDSIRLLQDCGIHFAKGAGLKSTAYNFPMELLYLRDDDIPGYVSDGVADAGIIGQNVVEEKNKILTVVEPLGFARCRLSIAVARSSTYTSAKDLQGMEIATSYPGILSRFLEKNQVTAGIHEISGSVEIAPSIGLAQAICDLVSSGSTLLSNGLREAEVIMESEALLVSNPGLSKEKQQIISDLLFRIRSVKKARNYKYILLNAPDSALEAIMKILPGMKSPTIMPLAEKGWSSMHSVVCEDDFWNVIGNLKAAGAEGILVLPIEKMIA